MRGLIYIFMLFIIVGCSYPGGESKELDEARELLENNPAAALSRLNDINIANFQDSATMASWALLYSEALVANSISAPTDTIVNIAVDYYRSHDMLSEYNKAIRLKSLLTSGKSDNQLATRLYVQKETEFLLYKERIKRERYGYTALLIVILAFGAIIWMRQRLRLRTAQNDALVAEASALKCAIEAGRRDKDLLEAKLHGLLDNRFTLIDSLCQTYYESQGTKIERKSIVDKVKSEIESVRTDSFADMERAVNDCRDNILKRVRQDFPGIKDEDYHLLVYIASGLSTRTICLLLDESVDVIYKRKSRLKSRLKSGEGTSAPDIMSIF